MAGSPLFRLFSNVLDSKMRPIKRPICLARTSRNFPLSDHARLWLRYSEFDTLTRQSADIQPHSDGSWRALQIWALTWSPRCDSFPWWFALCSLWWAGRAQASCCIWCNSRCSHENLLSKTDPSHPSVQHSNYFSLTSICLQPEKKKPYVRSELVSQPERSRGRRLSR